LSSPIIQVENLRKSYKLYSKPRDRLLELITANRVQRHMFKHALDGISFSLQPGDRLGIMGENGSGKSTLLKILTGVLTPTSGTMETRGKIAALLELGSGFHPDLTGVENVLQNGYIMGYSNEEMQERLPLISQFSELGDAINYPVKTYSSGMMMRLAFSCSVFVEPDILIVDEALAVGDAYFQTKCFFKIKELIDKGTTFVYVSHGQDAVRSLCNKALVLEHGLIIKEGVSSEVTDFYTSYMYAKINHSNQSINNAVCLGSEEVGNSMQCPVGYDPTAETHFSISEEFQKRVKEFRKGSGLARITDIHLLDENYNPTDNLHIGRDYIARVFFEAHTPLKPSFDIGMGITDFTGQTIIQLNTYTNGLSFECNDNYSRHIVDFKFNNNLSPGRHSIICGLADEVKGYAGELNMLSVHDACYGAIVFNVLHMPGHHTFGKIYHKVDLVHYQIK